MYTSISIKSRPEYVPKAGIVLKKYSHDRLAWLINPVFTTAVPLENVYKCLPVTLPYVSVVSIKRILNTNIWVQNRQVGELHLEDHL